MCSSLSFFWSSEILSIYCSCGAFLFLSLLPLSKDSCFFLRYPVIASICAHLSESHWQEHSVRDRKQRDAPTFNKTLPCDRVPSFPNLTAATSTTNGTRMFAKELCTLIGWRLFCCAEELGVKLGLAKPVLCFGGGVLLLHVWTLRLWSEGCRFESCGEQSSSTFVSLTWLLTLGAPETG